jgi:hypothetical protein
MTTGQLLNFQTMKTSVLSDRQAIFKGPMKSICPVPDLKRLPTVAASCLKVLR